MKERKQSGQNRIELTAEKIILTIPHVVAAAAADKKCEGELQKAVTGVNQIVKL